MNRIEILLVLRGLRKNWFAMSVAMLSLAVSIGSASAVYDTIRVVVLSRLPVQSPQELFVLTRSDGRESGVSEFSYPFFLEARKGLPASAQLLCSAAVVGSLETPGTGQKAWVELVSPNYFELLGVKAAIGRVLTGSDESAAGPKPVAVLSHRFWKAQLGGDPYVVGQNIRVSGVKVLVVGVTGPEFDGLDLGTSPDIRVPITMQRAIMGGKDRLVRRYQWLKVVARLSGGASAAQAGGSLTTVLREEMRGRGVAGEEVQKSQVLLITFEKGAQTLKRIVGTPLTIVMILVAMLFSMAAVSAFCIISTRAISRSRELAICRALGMTKFRFFGRIAAESMLLAGISGLGAVGCAMLARRILMSYLPTNALPFTLHVSISAETVLLTFAFCVLVCIAVSALPWYGVLRSVGTKMASSDRGIRREFLKVYRWLIPIHLGLSLALMDVTLLLSQTLQNLVRNLESKDAEHVIQATVDPSLAKYDDARIRTYYERLVREITAAMPDVHASVASVPLFSGQRSGGEVFLDGRKEPIEPYRNVVSPGYFKALGIPLLKGRVFDETDRQGQEPVTVVNELFAQRYFEDGDAIGKIMSDGITRYRIAGVVRNGNYAHLREATPSMWYVSYQQYTSVPPRMTLYVHLPKGAAFDIERLRNTLQVVDSNVPAYGLKRLRSQADEDLSGERLLLAVSSYLAVVAIVLAFLGIYGMTNYSVAMRQRELGIRAAVGAMQSDVMVLVLRQMAVLFAAGMAIAAIITFESHRFWKDFLYGITIADPFSIGIAGLLVGLLCFGAVYLPVRRALLTEPAELLRES